MTKKDLRRLIQEEIQNVVGEMTTVDNTRVQALLLKLSNKIKDSATLNKIKDFIKMDSLDAYITYDDLVKHLVNYFPNLFGKGKMYEPDLMEWLRESKMPKKKLK